MKTLRKHKGVTYDPEHVEAGRKVGTFRYGQETFWSAAHVVTAGICTDDDHAALMDLKETPYELMTATDHIAALVAEIRRIKREMPQEALDDMRQLAAPLFAELEKRKEGAA